MLTDRAKEIVSQTDEKMQEALNFLEEDLKTYRVGKANPAIFNIMERHIAKLCNLVHKNTLVFFPSYGLMKQMRP